MKTLITIGIGLGTLVLGASGVTAYRAHKNNCSMKDQALLDLAALKSRIPSFRREVPAEPVVESGPPV